MCIRDSYNTTHTNLRALRKWRYNRWAEFWQRSADGRCRNPCLLYTSDAADERSSVDLGGRRIIKKKKW